MKCPSCSADVEAAAAACPSCGNPVPSAAAAPQTSGQTGWGVELKSFNCSGCGASLAFDPAAMVAKCAYCGSEKIVVQPAPAPGTPAAAEMVRPDYVIPFKVPKEKTAEVFQKWVNSRWFAPGDLKTSAQAGPMRGVYMPYWSYDVDTSTWYECQVGKDHQVEESYTEKTADGQTVQKMRKVTKTDWSPAWGWISNSYHDLLVLASKGLAQAFVKHLEPFKHEDRVSYAPQMLAGWEAEKYAIDQETAWKQFGQAMVREKEEASAESSVRHQRQADRVRGMHLETRYSKVASKYLLLPLYISAYQYGGKTWQFAINGQTGRAHGERPKSIPKILAAVGAGLAVLVGLIVLIAVLGGGKDSAPAEKADEWTTKASAKELTLGKEVSGYARKLTAQEKDGRENSDVGSWYKVNLPGGKGTVHLEHVQGDGADMDLEIENADGKTLARGTRSGGDESVSVDFPGGTIFVRVYYYQGKADLFQYKIRVSEGR
jgi:DNA-directed RNA polymerase subunit RPC12/RpoP